MHPIQIRRVVVLALACLVPLAWAVPPAVVEAVQAPAWLERDGRLQALTPGTEIQNGDVLRTGVDARTYLLLAEGSRVKLGESANLVFYSRSLEPQSFFRGAMNIAKGAFRFTTGLAQRQRDREVTIRAATATIGIRGTDVWGRASVQGELVALIEGKIELSRAGQIVQLVPMSYMDARRDEAAEVKPLDLALLAKLAPETEIDEGQGARVGGAWALALDASDESSALAQYDRLRDAGFAARIRPTAKSLVAAGQWHYSVFIGGFASAAAAQASATRIHRVTGIHLVPSKPPR